MGHRTSKLSKRMKEEEEEKERKAEEAISNLPPPPPRPTKTIRLFPKLKPVHRYAREKETTLRSCIHTYAKEAERQVAKSKELLGYSNGGGAWKDFANINMDAQEHVKLKTPVLSSDDQPVIADGNYGFLSAIWKAYHHHYNLRTCPEDWWYTIIRKIAVAIDDHAKSEVVRNFFVSHEEKKTLSVEVGPDIYGVDYAWFLDQMTSQIADNLNVPEYVSVLKADFSTSTPTDVIVSEITAMCSLQEYFDFEMMTLCGIPNVEMGGEEEDWTRIKTKSVQLKSLLEPIRDVIGLSATWWNNVEEICDKLLKTFQGEPDTKWWSHIFSVQYPNGSGSCKYDGWFITKLLGLGKDEHGGKLENLGELDNGIVTVPMSIVDGMTGAREEAAFAGGIAGVEMFKETGSKWPSIQAVHGWVLMLEPDSQFRKELEKWESEIVKGG